MEKGRVFEMKEHYKINKNCTIFLLLVFLLLGCTGQISKEKMLDGAVELSWKDICFEKAENTVAAKEKYNGKICIFEGYIGEIYDEDYIELNWYEGDWMEQNVDSDNKLIITSPLRMDLDDEDAKKVKKGDKVKVVGKIKMDMETEFLNAYVLE